MQTPEFLHNIGRKKNILPTGPVGTATPPTPGILSRAVETIQKKTPEYAKEISSAVQDRSTKIVDGTKKMYASAGITRQSAYDAAKERVKDVPVVIVQSALMSLDHHHLRHNDKYYNSTGKPESVYDLVAKDRKQYSGVDTTHPTAKPPHFHSRWEGAVAPAAGFVGSNVLNTLWGLSIAGGGGVIAEGVRALMGENAYKAHARKSHTWEAGNRKGVHGVFIGLGFRLITTYSNFIEKQVSSHFLLKTGHLRKEADTFIQGIGGTVDRRTGAITLGADGFDQDAITRIAKDSVHNESKAINILRNTSRHVVAEQVLSDLQANRRWEKVNDATRNSMLQDAMEILVSETALRRAAEGGHIADNTDVFKLAYAKIHNVDLTDAQAVTDAGLSAAVVSDQDIQRSSEQLLAESLANKKDLLKRVQQGNIEAEWKAARRQKITNIAADVVKAATFGATINVIKGIGGLLWSGTTEASASAATGLVDNFKENLHAPKIGLPWNNGHHDTLTTSIERAKVNVSAPSGARIAIHTQSPQVSDQLYVPEVNGHTMYTDGFIQARAWDQIIQSKGLLAPGQHATLDQINKFKYFHHDASTMALYNATKDHIAASMKVLDTNTSTIIPADQIIAYQAPVIDAHTTVSSINSLPININANGVWDELSKAQAGVNARIANNPIIANVFRDIFVNQAHQIPSNLKDLMPSNGDFTSLLNKYTSLKLADREALLNYMKTQLPDIQFALLKQQLDNVVVVHQAAA